jgi:hypothetical protein
MEEMGSATISHTEMGSATITPPYVHNQETEWWLTPIPFVHIKILKGG